MLIGRVTPEREAVVDVEVLGSEGQATRVEAGIDTGYNGFLTLSKGVIEDLGLPFGGTAGAALGDGKEVRMDLYVAAVRWHGEVRDVLVLEAAGGALLGMAMLSECRLTIDVEENGIVRIEALKTARHEG